MTQRSSSHDSVRKHLARSSHTEPQDWYLVFKSRYGMEAVFRALKECEGAGDVLTQLFTCCTAIDPILSAGMKPVYNDIDPHTLHAINPVANSQVKAVLAQHTFGLVDDDYIMRVRQILPSALLLEDCAHCATRMARDNGKPIADISIHSFGVQKILPTRFGGAVWVNPELAEREPELDATIRRHLSALSPLTMRLNILTRLYVNQNRVLSRIPAGNRIRQYLTVAKMFEPVISKREFQGELEYDGMTTSPWIDAQVCRALEDLDANLETRKRTIRTYIDALDVFDNIEVPRGFLDKADQPFLVLPILMPSAQEADRAVEKLRAVGIYADNWYRCDLYPGVDNPVNYHVPQSRDGLEVTDDIESKILVLPTDIGEERGAQACRILQSVIQ